MKHPHLMITIGEGDHHGLHQRCKTCGQHFNYHTTAKFCPNCGVEFDLFYERKYVKRIRGAHDFSIKPRFKYAVMDGDKNILEDGFMMNKTNRYEVLGEIEEAIEWAEIEEREIDLKISCEYLNNKTGERK